MEESADDKLGRSLSTLSPLQLSLEVAVSSPRAMCDTLWRRGGALLAPLCCSQILFTPIKPQLLWKHASSLSQASVFFSCHQSSLLRRSYPVHSFKFTFAPDLSSKPHSYTTTTWELCVHVWQASHIQTKVLIALSGRSHSNLLLHHFFLILTNDYSPSHLTKLLFT